MKKTKKWIVFLAVIGLLIGFIWYQNNHLVVTPYRYENEKITEELDGYKIVQISDLHNAEFGENNKRLISKVEVLKPDMIVITGDIVDSNHTDIDISFDFVAEISKLCPVYYITGNHECWLSKNDKKTLLEGLEKSGAVVLQDKCEVIEVENSKFNLIGLDDKSLSDNALKNIMDNSDKNNLTVVLAHEPQYMEIYSSSDPDLVLSGHAHGGQFILPFFGPIVAPEQGFSPKYTSGAHKLGNTTMFISRGLGNSIIPLRLFNYPEIVAIELVKK